MEVLLRAAWMLSATRVQYSACCTMRALELLGKSISAPSPPSCTLYRHVAAASPCPFAAAKGLLGGQPCGTALGKGKALWILSAQPQLGKGPLSRSPASGVCQHAAVIPVPRGTGLSFYSDRAVLLFISVCRRVFCNAWGFATGSNPLALWAGNVQTAATCPLQERKPQSQPCSCTIPWERP